MSNRRKPVAPAGYRSGFLHSPAWRARRARWFRRQEALGRPLACAGCRLQAPREHLELHHLDYGGVRVIGGSWRAFERHSNLVPMHPFCHDLLHRIIDRDHGLSFHRTRRVASLVALELLRAKVRDSRKPS